jgi:hypothetical protein
MKKRNLKKGGLMFDTDLLIELDGTLMNKNSIEGTEYVTVIKQDGNQDFITGGSLNLNGKWIYHKVSNIKDKYHNIIGHKLKFNYKEENKNYASLVYNSYTDKINIIINNIRQYKNKLKTTVMKDYLKSFSKYIDHFEKRCNKIYGGLQFDFVEDITDKHEVYYPLKILDNLK